MTLIYKLILALYNIIFYIVCLISIFRLTIKSSREKIKGRLLLDKKEVKNKKYIWIHGASVGEVLSSKKLVNLLLQKYGNSVQIIITSHTETSRKIVNSSFNKNQVEHHYLPYDCGFLANKFINRYKPVGVIWLEQDFFPIILGKIHKKRIPLLLLNARFSNTSFKRWLKVKCIIKNILNNFDAIYPMSIFNKEKLDCLSDRDNKFIGNLKYTNILPKEEILSPLKEGIENIKIYLDGYNILVMLSMHIGEEEIINNLYKKLQKNNPKTKIILIPRHINKIDKIQSFLSKKGIKTSLYSQINTKENIEDLLIIDEMGKTNLICSLADITFIGKSLYMKGGHNLLEPLSVGCPVIFGKNMGNFRDIVEDALEYNSAVEISNEEELAEKVIYLFNNKKELEELKRNSLFVQKEGVEIIKKLEREINCHLKI